MKRKHVMIILLLALFAAGAVVVYNQYFSRAAKIRTFTTVKAAMDSLANELSSATPNAKWTGRKHYSTSDDPAAPCGYTLNGFDQSHVCSYGIETSFEVASQEALNEAVN